MIPSTFQRLADLDCLVRRNPKQSRCIVLLHGYGANFSDLTGLSGVLDPAETWDWCFPNGPLDMAAAGYAGKCWFPIDMQRLQMALMQSNRPPLKNENPPGFAEASRSLGRLFTELSEQYDKIVVGGFSQGSMVSCDFALHTDDPKLSALLLLSSNLVGNGRWETALAKRETNLPIFLSHGRSDPVLPFAGSEELRELFLKSGYGIETATFSGGHEIPYGVLEKLKVFLNKL